MSICRIHNEVMNDTIGCRLCNREPKVIKLEGLQFVKVSEPDKTIENAVLAIRKLIAAWHDVHPDFRVDLDTWRAGQSAVRDGMIAVKELEKLAAPMEAPTPLAAPTFPTPGTFGPFDYAEAEEIALAAPKKTAVIKTRAALERDEARRLIAEELDKDDGSFTSKWCRCGTRRLNTHGQCPLHGKDKNRSCSCSDDPFQCSVHWKMASALFPAGEKITVRHDIPSADALVDPGLLSYYPGWENYDPQDVLKAFETCPTVMLKNARFVKKDSFWVVEGDNQYGPAWYASTYIDNLRRLRGLRGTHDEPYVRIVNTENPRVEHASSGYRVDLAEALRRFSLPGYCIKGKTVTIYSYLINMDWKVMDTYRLV